MVGTVLYWIIFLNAIDEDLLKSCFASWVERLREQEPDIIAIDGRTSRRSHDRGRGRAPLHIVSAWATRQRLVLGQDANEHISNEIVAIPRLLERLELKGALVTTDAMRTQSEIAEKIGAKGGDYLLALKANRPATHKDVVRFFADPPADQIWGIEIRLHWVLDVVFHDDLARLRIGSGSQNMAVVKPIAMKLVRSGQ
ncbi:Predicted transposase YbfD/YdcC associated with H repeats [Sphingopyxis flava]|uniref:Predicted transposase YbfD/YdcC associated with H repeats n=1 Tax=Sphingopyxis flava TaxID=1507287 RepID=A0A1T5BI26_9SPHN|nr:ISAs1 family transposase [Sphingopyxis flava]SKB46659.1 Predicted transposase YbfD/YdcC associated with H repeats [Sphingopyxis flava]